jgi:hypothetical protein
LNRLGLLGALLLMVAPLAAQEAPDTTAAAVLQRQLDSLNAKIDSLEAAQLRTGKAIDRAFHPTPVYGATLGVALVGNYVFKIDRDPGGYRDSYGTSDKLAHFNTGYFLAARAIDVNVPVGWSVLLTCAAGYAFEHTQGYVSNRDAVAACSGALTAGGVALFRHKAKLRRER